MNKILVFAFLLCSCVIPSSLSATHIVGGDLTYECLGNDTYRVTLTIRRDCELGADDAPFDNPASIGIYDTDGNLQVLIGAFGQIILPFMGQDTIDSNLDSCGPVFGNVCVHEAIYQGVINIPSSLVMSKPNGLILVHQRCCRNSSLLNIVDPLETGATYQVHMTQQAMLSCDQSPVFKEWHPIYTCLNQPIVFDHSALDVEGDSLVYNLCTPIIGGSFDNPQPLPPLGPPFDEVVWSSGFSESNMITGSAPLTIDSQSGVLQGIPNLVGQFLVGVCVDEYRNGEYLTTVRRDFEINVEVCNIDVVSLFTFDQEDCPSSEVIFNNASQFADSYKWYFDFPNNDPAFCSTDINPVFEYPEEGEYLVVLEATRSSDGCQAAFIDTVFVSQDNVSADFDTRVQSCDLGSIELMFFDLTHMSTTVPITSYTWVIDNGESIFTGSDSEIDFVTNTISTLEVSLLVRFANGCSSSITRTIVVEDLLPDLDFRSDLLFCNNNGSYRIRLVDQTDHQDLIPNIWSWTISQNGNTTNLQGPVVDFDLDMSVDSVAISFMVGYNNGCESNLDTLVSASDLINVFQIVPSLVSCQPDGTNTYLFEYQLNPNSSFNENVTLVNWEISNSIGVLATGMDSTIMVTLEDQQDITVQLLLETDNCNFEIIENYTVEELFGALAFKFDLDFCDSDGIHLIISDASTHPVGTTVENYNWQIGGVIPDMAFIGNPIQVTVPESGVLNIDYGVDYTNGCRLDLMRSVNIDSILADFVQITFTRDSCTLNGSEYQFSVINNTNINIVSYQWSYSINGLVASSNSPILTLDVLSGDSVIVNLTTILANGCTIESNIITTIASLPEIEFFANPIIPCMGDTVPLIVNYDPSLAYSFNPTTGLIFINAQSSPLVVTNIAAIYEVTVSDGVCDFISEVEIDPNGEISLEIEYEITSCEDPLEFTFSPNISVSDTMIESYNWQYTINGLTNSGSDRDVMLALSENDSIALVLTVTFNNDCDPVTDSLNYIVVKPFLEFISDTINVCPNDTVPLLLNYNPNWNYEFSSLTGIVFPNPNSNEPFVSISNSMDYIVTVSDGACQEIGSVSVMSTLDGNLIIEGETIICDPILDLQILNGDDAFTYEWSFDPNFTDLLPSTNSSIQYEFADEFDSLILYVRVTAPGDPCFDGLIQEVVLRSIRPDIQFTPIYNSCALDTFDIEILVDSSEMITDIIWDAHPNIISGLSGPLITAIHDANAEDYILYFNTTNAIGCTRFDSISVIASERDTLSFDAMRGDCDTYLMCFDITSNYSGTLFWDFGTDVNQMDTIIGQTTPCWEYPSPGMYEVTVIDDSETCASVPVSDSVLVTEIIQLNTTLDTLLFSGDTTFILTAETNYPEDVIQWCLSDGTVLGTGDTIMYSPTNTVDVFAKVSDQADCIDSVSVHIMRFEGFMDIELAASSDLICTGDTIQLNLNSTMDLAGFEFEWSPRECIVDDSDPLMPSVTANSTKDFSVRITEPSMGFDSTLTITITVNEPDVNIIAPDGIDVFFGMDIDLEIENPISSSTYDWSNGDAGPFINWTPDSTDQEIAVLMIDEFGCEATDTLALNIILPRCNQEDVWLPNAFTPNGDGNNDVFFVRSNFIQSMELQVFNRWGERVFLSRDQSVGWDGSYKGEPVSPDAFAYSLRVTCVDGEEYVAVGNVTVIR